MKKLFLLTLLVATVFTDSFVDFGDIPELNDSNAEIKGVTYDDKNFLEKAISFGAEVLESLFTDTTQRCKGRSAFSGPDFMMFMPELKGRLYKEGDSITYENHCFKQNTMTLKSIKDGVLTIELYTKEKASFLCSDVTLFHNAQITHLSNPILPGTHTIKIKDLTEAQLLEVAVGGLRVFSFCDTFVNTIKSILNTISIFLPQNSNQVFSLNKGNKNLRKTKEEMEEDNLEILKKFAGIEPIKRTGYESTLLDLEPYIQSGDHLGTIQAASGLSTFIQLFSGGRISHSAIALRMDGQLYVVEAEGVGLIKTPYSDFVKARLNSRTTVAWFPLSPEYRSKFDETKAVNFAKERIGLPYGIKNFVFSLIDLKDRSLPPYMSGEHLLLITSLIEKVKADLAQMVYGYGINKRLGTTDLTIGELGYEAAKQGMSLEDVMVMPELDSWSYVDGESWICSALVAGVYKASGMFDGLEINAHEFTPNDVYQLAIYDKDFKNTRPDVCKQADPTLDYCIIVGPYAIHGNGYNSIEPYSHINERCPAIPPYFVRDEGC
jgi:hypothetical protein